MRNKVFVVGLDGGSFNLLQPWIEEGELPNIKDLMENGVCGEMKSTMPPMTAPAWNSIITGMNPGKHGVFDFMIRDRKTNRYLPVSSCIRQCNTIWDYVGRNRGKVVVLNIPTTYPPDPVQGVLISGWLTPAGRKDFIYPPEILPEIEDKFGEYLFYPRTLNVDDFLTECMEVLDYKFRVARYLVEQIDPFGGRFRAGMFVDQGIQLVAIFRTRGRRRELFGQHRLVADHVDEAAIDGVAGTGDIDVAVAGFEHARRDAGRMVVAGLRCDLAIHQPARGLEVEHEDLGLQQ